MLITSGVKKYLLHFSLASFRIYFWLSYVWNVWRTRRSHLKTVYNTAKSILPGYSYTENLSQTILSSAPAHFGFGRDKLFFLNIVRYSNKF